MKSIINIINLHFWKSITGPFFAFVFPIIFLTILGTLLGYDQLLGSIISIPSTTVALTVLPTALFEFKNSSLLKRIGVSSIKPWKFILSIAIYYIIIMFASSITTLCFGILIFYRYFDNGRVIAEFSGSQNVLDLMKTEKSFQIIAPSLKNTLSNVNWGCLIWSIFMNILISVTLGIYISSISKSVISIQGIGIPILIISEFLAAQVLPVAMVKEIDALYYASYITPFKYSTGLIIESWNGVPVKDFNAGIEQLNYVSSSNIFNVSQPFFAINSSNPGKLIVEVFATYDKVLNLVMPFILSGIFTGLTLKSFKWSSR